MSPGPSELEVVVREHARRVAAGDAAVRDDLAPEAQVEPPDLLERLLGEGFRRFELVAHARIGAQHVFKTKYVGADCRGPGPVGAGAGRAVADLRRGGGPRRGARGRVSLAFIERGL